MGATTRRALRWMENTDRLNLVAQRIKELAEDVDVILGSPAWANVTLLNGWTQASGSGGFAYTPSVRREVGLVILRARLSPGTTAANTDLLEVPAAYVPAYNIKFPATVYGGGVYESAELQLSTSGRLSLAEAMPAGRTVLEATAVWSLT